MRRLKRDLVGSEAEYIRIKNHMNEYVLCNTEHYHLGRWRKLVNRQLCDLIIIIRHLCN